MDYLKSLIDPAVLTWVSAALVYCLVLQAFREPPTMKWLCVIALGISAVALGSSFPAFLVMNSIAYGVVYVISKTKNRWQWTTVFLIVLAAVFTAARIGKWDSISVMVAGAHWPVYYLDMWMLLRLVTFTWEMGMDTGATPPLLRYFAWTSNPLIGGGPLLRFSQFSEVRRNPSVFRSRQWWIGFAHAMGMLLAAMAVTALSLAVKAGWPHGPAWTKAASFLFFGPWTFYLSFAGFYRMMEVLGQPCGILIPRSFNLPFFRSNISEFWANWNMTATSVFRDYFFYNRWGVRYYNIYFNTMVVFLFVGLWHAANLYWILFGLLHGFFFCTYLLWRRWGAGISNNRLIYAGGVALTYVAVCSGWYLPSKVIQALGLL